MTKYLRIPYSAVQCCTFLLLVAALISVGGFVSGCNYERTTDEPEKIPLAGSGEILLEKVDSIVLNPREFMFGRFHEYMEMNDKGTVLLFVDLMSQTVYLFDRQGDLINTIGSEGSGPEEFLQIISFDVDNDQVVIADESLYVVKVFSAEGTLLNNFRLFDEDDLVISSFGTHVNDQFLYVPIIETKHIQERSKSAIAAKIDLSTGDVTDLIGQHDPFTKQYKYHHAVQRFAIDDGSNQMITSLNGSPRLQIFDIESNKRIKYVVADIPGWKQLEDQVDAEMTRQESQALILGTSHIHRIFVNKQWIFQTFQTVTEEFVQTKDPLTKENRMALYDRKGSAFYGSVILPGLPAAVHNNQLFIIENMNPGQFTIGVYEFKVD